MEKHFAITSVKQAIQKIITDFDPKKYNNRDMELRGALYFVHIQNKDWQFDRLVQKLRKEKPQFKQQETENALIELIQMKYVDEGVG